MHPFIYYSIIWLTLRIGRLLSKHFYREKIAKFAKSFYELSKVLTDVLDMLPIGLVVISSDLKKVEHYSKESTNVFEIVHPNESESIYDKLTQSKLISEPTSCFKVSKKHYLVNKKSSNTGKLILSFTDVTAINELNIIKEESAHKTNLMQTLRHEIRTPLNGIIGVISTLKKKLKGTLDNESSQLISVAIHSSSMISTLLNNYSVCKLY